MNQSDLNSPASHAGQQRNLRKSDNDLGRNEVQLVQGDTMATSFQDPSTHFSVVTHFQYSLSEVGTSESVSVSSFLSNPRIKTHHNLEIDSNDTGHLNGTTE